MTQVTAQLVKELRERTGVGMGKCKEALEKAGGDLDRAIEDLRKMGMASAVKKEGREAHEGLIGVAETNQAALLIEINSETDFVCQNEKFKQFLQEAAEVAVAAQIDSVEKLLTTPTKHDRSLTVDEYRALVVQSLGENIQIRRLLLVKKTADTSVGIYSHMGGKIVSLVVLSGSSCQGALAKDVAMHVAAESPDYLRPNEIQSEIIDRERDIARSQMQGKPADIVSKIVENKVQAFYDQVCLTRQKYIKEPTISVQDFLSREAKKGGCSLEIASFARWQIGQQ